MTFIDRVQITLASGKGGRGAVHFQRTRTAPRGGPDGGDGGKGGDLILSPDPELQDLSHLINKKSYKAEDGKPGNESRKRGAEGKDFILDLPKGTQIYNLEGRLLKEIKNQNLLFLQGGKGGKGNHFFKNARVQAPQTAQPGESGKQKKVFLELRWQSDACLIGFRNSGKTSIALNLSHRKEKIYPSSRPRKFSIQQINDFSPMELVDLPGLSASTRKFLKQAEKTELIILVISLIEENPYEQYQKLQQELESYSQEQQVGLNKKPQLLVLVGEQTPETLLKETPFKKEDIKYVAFFSVKQEKKIDNLQKEIRSLLKK